MELMGSSLLNGNEKNMALHTTEVYQQTIGQVTPMEKIILLFLAKHALCRFPKKLKNFLSTMAEVDTGSVANDASVDDLSLGDDVLNSSKEYDNIGEEVFTKIENLPNAALVSETTSNHHVHDHVRLGPT